MNPLELTGRARTHLGPPDPSGVALHVQVARPFARLRESAREAGFDLRPASAFRDFERQRTLWNAKFLGDRPVLDAAGRLLDTRALPPAERVKAILVWSALPGASRHHWGTDLDLIDAAAIPADYRVRLVPEEFAADGPFGPLARWLDEHAARFGFFRPYRGVRSGVQAEPWHFSFAPVSETARRALTPGVLAEALADAVLEGKESVMARLEQLHASYVATIDWP